MPGLAEKLEQELSTVVPNTIHTQVNISPWRYNAAYLGAQVGNALRREFGEFLFFFSVFSGKFPIFRFFWFFSSDFLRILLIFGTKFPKFEFFMEFVVFLGFLVKIANF